MKQHCALAGALLAIFLCGANAQMDHSHMDMPGMSQERKSDDASLMEMASGTSMNPTSAGMSMIMTKQAGWNVMTMGQAFLVETQQSGPRGGDKLYSPNWFMLGAEHKLGGGSVMLQTMLSLDPATVTNRSYPLLFQTGETAYGKALVDAQHPHDFLMSLSVHYSHSIGAGTTLLLYYAPVGDPALGPVAFPHRASASELPQAPLGHHWQDSSHIANNVVTAAIRKSWFRLEASGFFGSEPDENRWNVDWGPMNSWAGRVSIFPAANWMAQFSTGRLTKPERQEAGDVLRTTGSVHYSRPFAGRSQWSTSLIWGRNHNTATKRDLQSWLAETVYPVSKRDFLTGRWEHVDKDELVPSGQVFTIQAYTFGYTRDIATLRTVTCGIGANGSLYAIPRAIRPYYGDHPRGVNLYLRFRLRSVQ